jgi:gliding motility-associated-like protein
MKPYIDWRDYEDRKCTDYKFSFEPYNVNCFPFKWEIFDSDNNSVADSTDLTKDELGVTFSLRLEANKDYTVKITDAKGRESSYPQRVNMESTNFNFYQSSYISNCVDGNGYIEIYGQMDSATRVRFVSGPQTPVHADTVFQEYTYNFYPFSQDHYPESLSMTEGDYVFEITDKCGGIHPITVPLKKSLEISGFSYTADEISGLCNSGEVRIYPHGKIYNNGNPVETWFSLIGTPDNPYHPDYSEKDISENDNSSYFSLTTKGKYVIGIRRMDYNYWWLDCVIDTIVIDHVPKEFTLEGRSSYVCETGTIGHIRVQAINGKLPYIYTLYNQDRATLVEGIEPNGTGAFEYGAFGEKYSVKVQDDCGTYFWIDVEITTLDQTTLLSGKTDICKDGSIELSCLLLGATEYRWSGPNDFSANTRTISIPNVTAVNSGEYTIEVKPAGCDKFFSSSINIKVHEVPLPDVLAPIDLCQADADLPLTIEPAAGYSIKWYDKDENPLSEAPIIDLRVFDDYVFHVEHVDNVFNCVGEKREVQAKVNPLPEKNAKATGWSCQDENPGITVTDVVEGYVYTVFADATATNPVMTFAGTADETMNLTLTATVRDDSTFYLQTATAAGCTLSPGIVAFQVEVDLLKMAPAKLPVYFHEVPYSVQLTGNIENPVFTRTDGSLVTGLSMTSEGLISGTVPASAGYAESTFTVTMNDENGCKTSNTYSLSSCGPAPEISDAELSYCEGSQSVPLEALSPNGFPLKWYDAEMNELSEAPTPATNIAGDQIFYVAQIDEALQCESAKAEIKVTVTPAPELDFEAQSDNICYGSSPTINLANLHSNYVYDISSDAQMTEKLTSFTGSTSGNLNLSAVPETSTSYYVLVTDDLTCMSINMEEVSINVIKLEILPDDLPVYFHETPYSVQLESNAEEPAFAYAGSLVTGIDMTSGGLISGTVPLSAGREESTFTVTVKDKNGCQTDKEYTLRTCEPKPDLPVDSIAYCAGAQATPIQASSPNGFPLQWYDYNLNKLQETPVPETDNVGEQTFYVAQINEILHCEGERAKVRVFVNPLPEIDFTASANDICFGESPSIILDNLHETYTYTVYSDSEFLNERGSTTGTDSTAVDIDDVLETNTSYYVLVTDSLGCTSSNWKEAPVTVIKLYIEPERLPQYQKNVEYEQRLTTNAQLPMFSIYAGYLPEGFSLNASGLLYGMFSGSTNNMRHVFTVEVQDSNGCNATREYTFTGEVIAPKAFTPNGDGVNDIFMQGYKVVIFDRLGIEMFRGDDGWDGTYKGKPVAPDIYFYKLEYLDANDDVKTKTGYVGVHY